MAPKVMDGLVTPSTRKVRRFRERQAEQKAAEVAALARRAAADQALSAPGGLSARWANEPRFFIESCLHVRHIDGGRAVPFVLSDLQAEVVKVLEQELAAGRAVRLAILKARRALISSLCEAIGYWATSNHAYTEGIILAHKQEVTEEIFQLCDTFYMLDERKVVGMRPATENSNRKELRFGNPNRATRDVAPGLQSGLRVTSADAKEPGRAGTYHFVHGSEVAYWPEGSPVWQSVGVALSNAPGTIGILESTANGQGGLFHETYQGARAGPGASDSRGRGVNEFVAIFLPWWRDRKNRLPKLTEAELSDFDYLTGEERRYAEQWKLDPEQVLWRRRTILSPICFKPGVKREDVFKQEYPADDEEAFLTSGKHFFLLSAVQTLEEHPEKGKREPKAVGDVVQDGRPLEDRSHQNKFPVKPKLVTEEGGPLSVWSFPRKGTPYLVVVDPAEGLQHGDASVVGVFDRARLDWAAFWSARYKSARELAWTACLLGWWYFDALLAIEHNNHGIATIEESRRILYPKLWQNVDVTRPGSDPTEKVGFVTTPASRMYALSQLEAEIRGVQMGIHDPEFFEQARTFVWPEAKGKALNGHAQGPRAMAGKHDDKVMTVAIGLAVHLNAGLPKVDLAKHFSGDVEKERGRLVPATKPMAIGELIKKARRVKKNPWF